MFLKLHTSFIKHYIYTVSQKSIPDIFDCNFKTNYQILIILVQIFLTHIAVK